MGDSLSVPPERSAANLFIIVHVVYAKTKKMADKSRLNGAVVFLAFILNISAANLSGFVRWKNDVFFIDSVVSSFFILAVFRRLEPGKPLVNQVNSLTSPYR